MRKKISIPFGKYEPLVFKMHEFILGCICICGIIILVFRNLYFTIISSIANNSFYLPFYLHEGFYLIIFIVFFIILFLMRKSIWKPVIIVILTISVFACSIWIYPVCNDLVLISKNEYQMVEFNKCEVHTKYLTGRYQGLEYILSYKNETDGKSISIFLSAGQFNELENKQKENPERKIIIYCLPNSGIILEYE
jgi:hypothetical protein